MFKFLRIVSLILLLKTNKNCWLIWFNFFGQKLWINISKFSLFHQKQHELRYFSPFWLNLHVPAVHPQNNTNTIFVDSKRGYFYSKFHWECPVIKILPSFANFTRWLSKMQNLILSFQLTNYLYLQHLKNQLILRDNKN